MGAIQTRVETVSGLLTGVVHLLFHAWTSGASYNEGADSKPIELEILLRHGHHFPLHPFLSGIHLLFFGELHPPQIPLQPFRFSTQISITFF